jgi:hypothetical protein
MKKYDLDNFKEKFINEQQCDYDCLMNIFNNKINKNIENINKLFEKYNKNKINSINNRKIIIKTNINEKFYIEMNITYNGYNEEEINKFIENDGEFENKVYQEYKIWFDNLQIPKSNKDDEYEKYLDKIIEDEVEKSKIEEKIKKIYKPPDINCCKEIKQNILKKVNLFEKQINYKREYSNKCKHILHIYFDFKDCIIHNNEPYINIEKIC